MYVGCWGKGASGTERKNYMEKIAKRSDKIAFYGIPDGDKITYQRMRGFTEFSMNKNPTEYTRRYVDEKTERSDIVGYAPSISYSFDKFTSDPVHQDMIMITDNELVGGEAVRRILIVDLSSETDGVCTAIDRAWAVIPDAEGNDTDAYTYSGTLKSNGEIVKGTAQSEDDWQTCTFLAI